MPRQKPNGCMECTCFGDGLGYVEDVLNEGAPVLVIDMFPSQYEATRGESQVGMNVDAFNRDFVKFAGPVAMSHANVIRCRGQRGTKLPTGKKLKDAVAFCRQYDRVPDSTQLVVFVGVDVVKHLAPDTKEPVNWRGFLLQREVKDES